MLWVVLTRSRKMRLLVAILEKSFLFFFDESRCSSALFLGRVVYPDPSSSPDEHHHLSHSCLGTGMRFGTQNKFCHYRASLVQSVSAIVRRCCWCFWWKQYHDTAISGTDYVDLRNRDNFCSVCVLVNTLQYHDTFDIVQDSETEDPHQACLCPCPSRICFCQACLWFRRPCQTVHSFDCFARIQLSFDTLSPCDCNFHTMTNFIEIFDLDSPSPTGPSEQAACSFLLIQHVRFVSRISSFPSKKIRVDEQVMTKTTFLQTFDGDSNFDQI